MLINVAFPAVLKTTFAVNLNIPPEPQLIEIKTLILQKFWESFPKVFYPNIGAHGTAAQVTLYDDDIVIDTDAVLQQRLAQTTNFQVVFKEHASS